MTITVLESAAVTLTSQPTTVTSPLIQSLSGLISYGSLTVVQESVIFSPGSISFDLSNQSTISLQGSIRGVGRAPNFQTGTSGYNSLGFASAVNLYGTGTFTNSGLVESSLIETIVSPIATTTPLFEFTTDGVFIGGGTLINQQQGTIEAVGVAAYANGVGEAAIINNAGLIEGVQYSEIGQQTTGSVTSIYTITGFGDGAELGAYVSSISVTTVNTLMNSGIIEGGVGVLVSGSASINNAGTIKSDGFLTVTGSSIGLSSPDGAAIYGKYIYGLYVNGSFTPNQPSELNIDNTGLISSAATDGVGINFEAGTVTNETKGTIFGYNTAILAGDPRQLNNTIGIGGTVINGGMVIGGISAFSSANIDNQTGGQISGGHGGVGIYLNNATLINAGTVSGTKDAVSFGAAGGTVIVDPGAVFSGSIAATSALDVIAFQAPSAGSSISLSSAFGSGGSFDFSSVSSITVEANVAQLASGEAISGLTQGDTIKLDGFAATAETFVAGTGLVLSNGSSSVTLDIQGSFTTSDFTVTDPPAITTIAVNANPCFAAGTKILTEHGQVAVESLNVGDNLLLQPGKIAPIIWIGRRRINISRHRRPEWVNPILIAADAIADGVPANDLYVSPDHAIALEGNLIPAKILLNGSSIRQVNRRSITYYHIELAEHAILYANGCPAESYLETGNRGAFDNSQAPITLHPNFAQLQREKTGCAPFIEAGPIVEQIRATLLARANINTTADPDLTITLSADGAAIIGSRSAVPGQITPDPRDQRTLGVKITELRVGNRQIPLDHPALVTGWHDVEPDGRWTNGKAIIPANLIAGAPVSVSLGSTMPYPIRTESPDSGHGDVEPVALEY